MANASVEISGVRVIGSTFEHLFGPCVRQETLAISGTTATGAALTQAESVAVDGETIARIVTDDTACFVAKGTTPDPTAQAATTATTAKRYLPAYSELVVRIAVGDKIAVHT